MSINGDESALAKKRVGYRAAGLFDPQSANCRPLICLFCRSESCFEFDDTNGDAFRGCAPIVDIFHTDQGLTAFMTMATAQMRIVVATVATLATVATAATA